MAAPPGDITDFIASLIVLLDPQMRVVRMNRACEQAIGRPRESAVGLQFCDLFVQPSDVPVLERQLAQARQSGPPDNCGCALPATGGERRLFTWTFSPAQDGPDDPGIVATGTEITAYRRDQDLLREQAELFRMAVAHSPDLIFYQDTEFRLTWVSRTIPPATLADVLGKTDFDFIDPQEAARLAVIKRRILRTGVGERMETRVLVGDEWHYLETVVERRTAADGTILGVVGYARDVTERKRVEEQLKAVNETLEKRVADRTADLAARTDALARSQQAFADQTRLLELILDSMADGVAVVDRNGKFIVFNPAARRIIGREPLEVPPPQWSEHFGFFLPDRVTPYPLTKLPLQRAMRGEHGGDAEIFVRNPARPEGLWMFTTSRPIFDDRGNPAGAVAVLHDLTTRKRHEEALRLSERRLRLLIEQAPISIQTFSPDGFVLGANMAWEKLFGVTVADIPGYNVLQDQQLVEKGLMPQIGRAFSGEPVSIEPMFYVPDRGQYSGQSRWMQAWMYPVRDENGKVREVVLIHQDITDKKHAEDRLRESERHYRELADYNRRLVREVEHRVRNNISGLIGLVEVMRHSTASVPAFADAIEGRLRALAHVHDLLATSGWQSIGLRKLVSSTLAALQHMSPHPALQAVAGPDINVPPHRVSPLTMILVEWFTNSCKYGAHSQPGGRLDVSWEASPELIRLRWHESGGPPAPVCPTPSLGTELVNAFATRELEGRCWMDFRADGASHVLEFPSSNGMEPQPPGHPPDVK